MSRHSYAESKTLKFYRPHFKEAKLSMSLFTLILATNDSEYNLPLINLIEGTKIEYVPLNHKQANCFCNFLINFL